MDTSSAMKPRGDYPIPADETERIEALHRFELLDTPPEPFFDHIVQLAVKLLNVPIALVSLVDKDRQWSKARIGVAAHAVPREHSFCAHALESKNILVIEDATRDPRFLLNPLVAQENGIRFYAGAPLRTRDGHTLGTVCVLDRMPHLTLTPDERQTLKDLSELVMAHIEARQQVGYLSPVTSLSNRFRFIDDVDAFIAEFRGQEQHAAALMIDCALPREYDDLARALGYAYADAFEVAAAKRIRQIVPERVKLYHISNCRFCFILSSQNRDEVENLAEKLADDLRDPLSCHGIPIRATTSVGIAYCPGDGDNGENLLRAVTSVTQQAQEQRRSWTSYLAESDQRRQHAFRLLTDVPLALEGTGQFHLHFQPKICLRNGRCYGAEALLRWNHPTLGAISPGEIIPLIEQTALMRPVTEWVLNSAFHQIAAWRESGFALPISVNISARDLESGKFHEQLAALLTRHHLQPDSIDIEITESALMPAQFNATRQLHAIREMGVAIEIDDFGTGQSALSYLKYIPATMVKIDQIFVRHLDENAKDQRIVRSTIDLAHDLGYRVTAEGIESDSVMAWLREQGCDVGQGYAISRPLPPQEFRRWAEQRNAMPQP